MFEGFSSQCLPLRPTCCRRLVITRLLLENFSGTLRAGQLSTYLEVVCDGFKIRLLIDIQHCSLITAP